MKWFQTASVALCLSLFALALGCGGESVDEEPPSGSPGPDATVLKGHAVFGHEVRSVRPCEVEEALWAIDSTQALWEVHRELAPGLDPYEEVFVVVRGHEGDAPSEGFGADYSRSFLVDQVSYAAAEGFGCQLDLSGFLFRISGNEPFWTLRITGSAAELSRMDGPARSWTDIRVTTLANGATVEADDTETDALEVVIREEPCRDSMSGAYFAYRASVVVGSSHLEGCALRGAGI